MRIPQWTACFFSVAFAFFSLDLYAQETALVSAAITLTPAGEFTATSPKVMGKLTTDGARLVAKEIAVPIDSLTTGIDLRDEHLRKRLGWPDVKTVVVRDVAIARDEGKGVLVLNKVTKPISFKVTNRDKDALTVTFPLSLNDFDIKNIRYLNVGVQDEVVVTATVPHEK